MKTESFLRLWSKERKCGHGNLGDAPGSDLGVGGIDQSARDPQDADHHGDGGRVYRDPVAKGLLPDDGWAERGSWSGGRSRAV